MSAPMGTRMDAETLAALRETLREVFGDVRNTGATPDGHAASRASAALVELGWSEAHAEDPAATAVALFEEQGAALGGSRELAALLLDALGMTAPARSLALPHPGGIARAGIVVGGLDGIDEIVVPVDVDGDIGLATVTVGTPTTGRVEGLDPAYGLIEVSIENGGDVMPLDLPGGDAWAEVLALGRRLLASELVGVGRAALATASVHVTDRTQFGRPIGSFQAVRHRLAEAHVQLSAARDLIDASWDSGQPRDSTVAKIAAGHAVDTTVRSAMQVCGAIGLTWEHVLHRYVRRAGVLDVLLGSADSLEHQLGSELARAAG